MCNKPSCGLATPQKLETNNVSNRGIDGRAMTSLVAEVPLEGGLALASQVYSPHLDLRQRLLILDTLSTAAQQLSLPPSQAKVLQRQQVTWSLMLVRGDF